MDALLGRPTIAGLVGDEDGDYELSRWSLEVRLGQLSKSSPTSLGLNLEGRRRESANDNTPG